MGKREHGVQVRRADGERLGVGKRLFADGGDAVSLEFAETRQVGSVVVITLRPRT